MHAVEIKLESEARIGATGISVNAQVLTSGFSGQYWVVYGQNGVLDQRTPKLPLPPAKEAFLSEEWGQSTSGWNGGLSGKDLVYLKDPDGDGFVRYLGPQEKENQAFPGEPPGLDVNHVDGIGSLNLCSYIYSARLGGNPLKAISGAGLNLGGGKPDLRDAVVQLRLRGNNFDPNGAEIIFWAQSDHDQRLQRTEKWVRANWAYTSKTLTHHAESGRWEEISYSLDNNSSKWSYAGNNLSQERPERYSYLNLNDSLADLNGNFFHLLAFVDPTKGPTGTLDFDGLKIRYRNHSLLLPMHGAELIEAPAGSQSPAALLTDGWRHGQGHEWISQIKPKVPQVFTWRFRRAVCLQVLQVHQSTAHPAREVVALTSQDGITWERLTRIEMASQSTIGPNHNYHLIDINVPAAKFFRLEVHSGYDLEAWALGEVELFGSGADLASDNDWTNLNVDLTELRAGAKYSYQFVIDTTAGTFTSTVGTMTTTSDSQPILVGLTKQPTYHAKTIDLWARVNPMGQPTYAYLEFFENESWVRATPDQYVGRQLVERDVKFENCHVLQDEKAKYRIILSNASAQVISTPAPFESLTPHSK